MKLPSPSRYNAHKRDNKLENKSVKAPGQGLRSQFYFDPFETISSIEEYETFWHVAADLTNPLATNAVTSTHSMDSGFPSSLEECKYSSNPYLAVNGRHPSPLHADNGNGTCWLTPVAPLKDDHFGLRFFMPRDVKQVGMVGSKILGNIIGEGEEDLTAESWEVWTLNGDSVENLIANEEVWVSRMLSLSNRVKHRKAEH